MPSGAVVGARATVGPFTYLRPGTVLGEGSKAGAYVEIKASEMGAGSKVPHLSYVGDATIGTGCNIGPPPSSSTTTAATSTAPWSATASGSAATRCWSLPSRWATAPTPRPAP